MIGQVGRAGPMQAALVGGELPSPCVIKTLRLLATRNGFSMKAIFHSGSRQEMPILDFSHKNRLALIK